MGHKRASDATEELEQEINICETVLLTALNTDYSNFLEQLLDGKEFPEPNPATELKEQCPRKDSDYKYKLCLKKFTFKEPFAPNVIVSSAAEPIRSNPKYCVELSSFIEKFF